MNRTPPPQLNNAERRERPSSFDPWRFLQKVLLYLRTHRGILLVFLAYLLLLLTRTVDTTGVREDGYLVLSVLQILAFLIPTLLYLKIEGWPCISRLRLSPPQLPALALVPIAIPLIVSGGLLVGIVFGRMSAFAGSFTLYDTFVSQNNRNTAEVFHLILTYAVLPALCEELIFRGVVCQEYEKHGLPSAIILSSLLFAMLHFNFPKLPTFFYAGLILAMVLYATRSLFCSMLVHFAYNLFGLFGQEYMYNLYKEAGDEDIFTYLIILIFLISASAFSLVAAGIYRKYARQQLSNEYRARLPFGKTMVLLGRDLLSPLSLLCLLVYILVITLQ